jgi:hypothetical protein
LIIEILEKRLYNLSGKTGKQEIDSRAGLFAKNNVSQIVGALGTDPTSVRIPRSSTRAFAAEGLPAREKARRADFFVDAIPQHFLDLYGSVAQLKERSQSCGIFQLRLFSGWRSAGECDTGQRNSQTPGTHCTRKSPLPLLPSGPGGVGGNASRGTDA